MSEVIPLVGSPGGEIVVYEAPDGEVRVDVRLQQETAWLSLSQIADLFARDQSVISRHFRTIFSLGELDRAAVVAKIATAAADAKTRSSTSTSTPSFRSGTASLC